MPRRSYAHYCAIARSLDVIGERWTLLIIRELLPGPRRYTELHADLPGISTDVLAARLKEMEADGLLTRHRVAPPTPAWVYELTPRGRALLPVFSALAHWGGDLLDRKQPTDALRRHWLALPLVSLLQQAAPGHHGVVELRIDGTTCYLCLNDDDPAPAYGRPAEPSAVLTLSTETAMQLTNGNDSVARALSAGHLHIDGKSDLAQALRGQPTSRTGTLRNQGVRGPPRPGHRHPPMEQIPARASSLSRAAPGHVSTPLVVITRVRLVGRERAGPAR